MRAILFSIFILLSIGNASGQSIFDTASCGGISQLAGFGADTIFFKSKEWVKQNITPLNYTDNQTNGAIRVTALEDYNAKASDKLPEKYSGKFEYNLVINVKDGYYSYDFVNVKYIPKNKLGEALKDPVENDTKPVRIKKKTWDKISRSAFIQLQEKGKNFDAFMQKC